MRIRKGQVFVTLEIEQHDLLARDAHVDMRREEIGSAHQDFRNSSARMSRLFKTFSPRARRPGAAAAAGLRRLLQVMESGA
jgi:hypothetical protein